MLPQLPPLLPLPPTHQYRNRAIILNSIAILWYIGIAKLLDTNLHIIEEK